MYKMIEQKAMHLYHEFVLLLNNKKIFYNLYKDIVLVTRLRIFCTTLFINNNIKIVIQMHTFLLDPLFSWRKREKLNVTLLYSVQKG